MTIYIRQQQRIELLRELDPIPRYLLYFVKEKMDLVDGITFLVAKLLYKR